MADLKNVSCPNCHQKYRLPDSIENRKVVCRACQVAFTVPWEGAESDSGGSPVEQSQASFDGGMFDSIDVDDLLNAKSSGLSQRRREIISPTDDMPKRDAQEVQQKQEEPVARRVDPDDETTPVERPAALPITVLDRSKKRSKRDKRKKKQKKAAPEPEDESDFVDAQSDPFEERKKSNDPIDPEEQAVFDYVRAVNGRKNTFAILIALAIAVGIGGWFAVQEIDRLKTPLTQEERDILEDEGFRLKAVRGPMKGQFAALGKGVPRVGVVPGIRLDQFGQIERKFERKRVEDKFDPNAAFGNDRQPRKQVKREQPVDLDTRVVAERKSNSFSVGNGKGWGPALAVSPSNVVFVPEGDGLGCYDLVSKKQLDYKTVGRLAGRLDRISALAATPDARFVVAGFDSGRIKLFQLDEQSRFFEIGRLRQKHYKPIRQIVCSPDSSLFATVDDEGQLAVSNVTSGENKWKRKIEPSQDGPRQQRCLDLGFSSDGQQLLIAMTDSDLVLNASDGNELILKKRPPRKTAVMVPNDQFAISCTENEISAFSLKSDVELWKKSIRKTQAPVIGIDASGTNGLFFDGGKSIIRFDLQTGDLIGRLSPVNGLGHRPEAKPVVSADGKYLLYGSRSYRNGKLPVNLVDLPQGDQVDLPPALALPPRSIPALWDAQEGKRSRKHILVAPPNSGKKISAVTLNDDGLLFYSTASGSLNVYDWTNGILLQEISIDSSKSISALATCGKWLAVGLSSGGILLYEVQASGRLRSHGGVFGHESAVVGIRAMPVKENSEVKEPCSIASVSRDGNLRVWDIPSRGSLLNVKTFREPPNELVVLDDSKILIASTIRLATVNIDTQKVTVEGSRKGGTRVALSPDGKKLAFVNQNAIKIAKTRTGVAGDPVPLEQAPGAIQFTRDSRFLHVILPNKVGVVNYKNGKTIDTIDAEIRPHTALDTIFALSSEGALMAAITKNGTKIIVLPVEK